jgi:hypothetical protein
MCIDEKNSETSGFQDLKERDPVNSRRFHRHGLDAAGFQPVSGDVQVFRKRRETAYGLWIAVRRHGDVYLGCSYIHTGSIQLKTR